MSKRKADRVRRGKNGESLIPGTVIKKISRDASTGTRNLFQGIGKGLFFPYRGIKERRK